jgi:hypothetical protein
MTFRHYRKFRKEIFKIFFREDNQLLHKDNDYAGYDMKTKMLSFYFTFFELLTANRSYVTMSLKKYDSNIKNLLQLSGLKEVLKHMSQIL